MAVELRKTAMNDSGQTWGTELTTKQLMMPVIFERSDIILQAPSNTSAVHTSTVLRKSNFDPCLYNLVAVSWRKAWI
jgi:hypothetical protein